MNIYSVIGLDFRLGGYGRCFENMIIVVLNIYQIMVNY